MTDLYPPVPVVKNESEAKRWKVSKPPYKVYGPYKDNGFAPVDREGLNVLIHRKYGVVSTCSKTLAQKLAKKWNR